MWERLYRDAHNFPVALFLIGEAGYDGTRGYDD